MSSMVKTGRFAVTSDPILALKAAEPNQSYRMAESRSGRVMHREMSPSGRMITRFDSANKRAAQEFEGWEGEDDL